MDKLFKDILPDTDPYHNHGRDQMRKKGGPEFECLWLHRALCFHVTALLHDPQDHLGVHGPRFIYVSPDMVMRSISR
jgi:hypothetical protein